MKPSFFKLTKDQLHNLTPLKSIATHDETGNFDRDGLFSIPSFGDIGSKERMLNFGYIPLNTDIISPHLYHEITKLSSFYKDILTGKRYAIWDTKLKIFTESDYVEGKTGYSFFTEHLKDIQWMRTSSKKRDQKIAILDKFRDVTLIDNLVILPAGLRDYIIKDGKGSEDEINPIYRRILSLTQLLENSDGRHPNSDSIRTRIQSSVQDIYKLIMTIQDGKGGFIQNKWVKRSIIAGTRNVITATVHKVKDLRKEESLGSNDSMVGIYQYAMGIYTKMDFLLRDTIVNRVLGTGNEASVTLVDPKTNKFVRVDGSIKAISNMMSIKGLESGITKKLKLSDYAYKPVAVGDYYLAKVYDDGENILPVYGDILPDVLNASNGDVKPNPKFIRLMTYMDIVCLAILNDAKTAFGLMTRYPITQQGSIYPTKLFIRPTLEIRTVEVFNEQGIVMYKLNNYPVSNSLVQTAMSVHQSKLNNLGGDHDGDKLALTVLLSGEAIQQVKDMLNRTASYITPDGKWVDVLDNTISGHVLKHITRGLSKPKKEK